MYVSPGDRRLGRGLTEGAEGAVDMSPGDRRPGRRRTGGLETQETMGYLGKGLTCGASKHRDFVDVASSGGACATIPKKAMQLYPMPVAPSWAPIQQEPPLYERFCLNWNDRDFV